MTRSQLRSNYREDQVKEQKVCHSLRIQLLSVKNNWRAINMSKVLLFVLIALMTVSLIVASTTGDTCGRHGDPCVSDSECCGGIKCHRYARKCQVQITKEELMAQHEKILGRRGKDY